jgi:hypothetical protein
VASSSRFSDGVGRALRAVSKTARERAQARAQARAPRVREVPRDPQAIAERRIDAARDRLRSTIAPQKPGPDEDQGEDEDEGEDAP